MKTYQGYIYEARESEEAGEKSYDDMECVGVVRIGKGRDVTEGDDLNDAPYNCNGQIFSGREVALKKGDYIIIIKQRWLSGL